MPAGDPCVAGSSCRANNTRGRYAEPCCEFLQSTLRPWLNGRPGSQQRHRRLLQTRGHPADLVRGLG
ncbi:hypothetical protein C1Y07_30830, partial [Pseudomonas sp. FW306-02-F02-AB]